MRPSSECGTGWCCVAAANACRVALLSTGVAVRRSTSAARGGMIPFLHFKVRAAYRAVDRATEWQTYLGERMTHHRRKYRLMSRLEALKRSPWARVSRQEA